MNKTELHPADKEAIDAIVAVNPTWHAQVLAAQALSLPSNTLLHAGPAFKSPTEITRPIMHSACVAAVYEGLTPDFESAARDILNAEILLRPAQDFNLVTPLAAVVSSRMWLHEIVDSNNTKTSAYAPINGGNGPAMRLGLCNNEVLAHIRWLNGEFAECLAQVDELPADLLAIARFSLTQDDDCHGRTAAATRQLLISLEKEIGRNSTALEFLQDGPSFFLNLWMAACKCMLDAAVGISNSSLITAMGANGLDAGIQIAGLPGHWFCSPADVPHGDIGEFLNTRALAALGDSAIVDACGFGAMAMNYSGTQKLALGAFMPQDGLQRPAQILGRVHPGFGELNLLTGLLGRRVIETARAPLVSLGILDKEGITGRLGGGILTMPVKPFRQAMLCLQQKQ